MSEQVWLALIVIIPTLVATLVPVFMKVIDNKERRRDRAEDLASQEMVAHEAKKAATLVAEKADQVADVLTANNAQIGGQLNELSSGQKQIHTLVNSNLTSEMQENLTATKAQLVLMREVMALRKGRGGKPTDEVLSAISLLEKSIAEKERLLVERKKVTEKAEIDKKIRGAEAGGNLAVQQQQTAGALVDAADKMAGAADVMERTAEKADATIDKLTRK